MGEFHSIGPKKQLQFPISKNQTKSLENLENLRKTRKVFKKSWEILKIVSKKSENLWVIFQNNRKNFKKVTKSRFWSFVSTGCYFCVKCVWYCSDLDASWKINAEHQLCCVSQSHYRLCSQSLSHTFWEANRTFTTSILSHLKSTLLSISNYLH